jgi:hypothetical protein
MGEYSVVANAQTNGGTNIDGTREKDISEWEIIQLDGNEYFNPSDSGVYRLEIIGTRGETGDHVEWDDWAEPIPGLRLPRKLKFRTSCWSPAVPPLTNVGVHGRREVRLTAKSIEIG